MNIDFELFGRKYVFKMKLESKEDAEKLKKIINDICNHVDNNYKNLAYDKKIALVILFLAYRVLKKDKIIDKLNQTLKDYETALNFVEKMDEQ